MPKVNDIKVLTIDEVQYDVEKMSKEVQAMVEVFNGWNQKSVDLTDELNMVTAAKNELSRNIILQVKREVEKAEPNDEAISEGEDTATDPAA